MIVSDKRKKKIRGAMKLGYSPDDLKQAIDGCASSSFHMGQNDRQMVYDGLDLIFRDADHIDKFIKLQQMPAGPGQQEPEWLDGWLSGGGNAGYWQARILRGHGVDVRGVRQVGAQQGAGARLLGSAERIRHAGSKQGFQCLAWQS